MGIEPTPSAWKAEVLPLNYTRGTFVMTAPPQRTPIIAIADARHQLPNRSRLTIMRLDCWWRGEDSNLRRLSRQIYSLIPLTAREPLRIERHSLGPHGGQVNKGL